MTSLVILNYNDPERTLSLARKAASYGELDHIVIVDNCSTDDSADILGKEAGGKIRLICREENGGYARGNNTGVCYALKELKSDIVFIANPDVSFSEETVAAMKKALKEDPEYGLIAPLVNQGYNAWHLPGFGGIIVSLFLFAFTFEKILERKRIEIVGRSGKEVVTTGAAEGSFFAISADAYKAARGFDERTFLYAEEIILSYRLKKKGYLTGIMPSERYDHLHSASIKKIYRSSKAAAFHHFYDSFRIYNKYYLKTGPFRDLIFKVCWYAGYLERKIYDALKG